MGSPSSYAQDPQKRGAARIGCSGWSYPDWRGVIYPAASPARSWFGLYAAMFDTVEINSTFYRLPSVPTVDTWRQQAPAGFRYALKVGRYGTHRRKLRDPEAWLPNHVDRALRLGEHLGPNLLQLPPHWHRDVARLDDLLSVASTIGPALQWAVEFRDPSWLHDSVYSVLAGHGAALCIHDLIEGHPWQRTAGWTYLRFHGPDASRHTYQGRYGGRRLWRVADRLGGWLDGGCDVYAYFNNDIGGDAVFDAAWLRDRCAAASGSGAASCTR